MDLKKKLEDLKEKAKKREEAWYRMAFPGLYDANHQRNPAQIEVPGKRARRRRRNKK